METKTFFILPSKAKYLGYLFILVSIALSIILLMKEKTIIDFFGNSDIKTKAIYVILLLGLSIIIFSKPTKNKESTINRVNNALKISLLIAITYFVVFSFTNITLIMVNLPSIIFIDLYLIVYLIVYSFFTKE